ncbi:ATP-binding protein [Actinomadura latina]|uniref:Tetratricopeptide repeat protein n=1 Tax=Actinomadura latina TaxID=163603 RepID=A0A846Z8A4_9ACTN|nr:tetratricopeptide repeat protein [Actinomadura latina]NKZ06306.1 tetratricopeptide repeat protein [Actinomadura latina]
MSPWRRPPYLLSLFGLTCLLVALATLFAVLGLDAADKVASVLGAFSGVLGLVIAGIGLTQAQTTQREAAAEQLAALSRALRRPPAIPARATRSLPTDIPDFVNRDSTLRRIEAAAGSTAASTAAICTINGMAGVGKTTLAVHAAHGLAGSFPDGALFLNLHAHSADQAPVSPDRALEALLHAVGLAPDQVPESLEERAALWRSETANSRRLLLLDNAADQEQVVPLIPAGPCLTIITSRRRLVLDGGRVVGLNALAIQDAVQLLSHVVGTERLRGHSADAREIVSRCGCLPLAVRLVAGHLESHPAWTPGNLLSEMAASEGPDDAPVPGQNGVMAALHPSYEGIAPDHQRLLRRLALHPGPEFGVHAAVALYGGTLAETVLGLDALTDQSLLEEPAYRRYRMHDLVRDYVAHRADEDPPAETSAAEDRAIDYYTVLTLRAERIINLLGSRDFEDEIEHPPVETPVFASHAEAMTWLETERPNLHACVELAIDTGRPARAARLARAMAYFLRLGGHWKDAADLCRRAARWCADLDDVTCAADMKFLSGDIARLSGHQREARAFYEEALAVYHDLADRYWEARTLHSIGDIERMQGQYNAAIGIYTRALTAYESTGNRLATARALHSIADAHRLAGDGNAAMDHYESILDMYRELNDPVGTARALHSIADVHVLNGDGPRALPSFRDALRTYRMLGDRLGEADTLNSIGVAHLAGGDREEGIRHLREAVGLYVALGDHRQEARTRMALGRAATSDPEEAVTSCEAAVAASQEVDDPLLRADAERALAMALLSGGRQDEARAHVRTALTLLRNLGSPLAETVQAELDRLGGP